MNSRLLAVVSLITNLVALGCQPPEAAVTSEPSPRPVTVMVLTTSVPSGALRSSGSVTSWKTEDIGFEVAGRIAEIIEPGRDAAGPQIPPDGRGAIPASGAVLAKLDPSRYEASLATAKARVVSMQAQLQAAVREIEQVLPKRQSATAAARKLAEQEFARQKELRAGKATTEVAYDKAAADLEVAIAEEEQLTSMIAVKESERAAVAAQVAEAEELVRQAQKDLDDTTLYAPFTGQIASVFETVGGVVQSGEPVIKLQMMDPIQVDVQLSPARDALLHYNDIVTVYTPDTREPVPAMVYEKAAIADPATRTFLLSLLIRNEQVADGLPAEFSPESDLRTRSVWGLFSRHSGDRGPFYVNEESLIKDEQGNTFVLRIRGVARRTREESSLAIPSVLPVERVPVVPSDERLSFLSAAVLRRLDDTGGLDPNSDLVVGRLRTMAGDPLTDVEAARRAKDLNQVFLVRERWRFRPGDVVEVDLADSRVTEGLYVPMNAIVLGPAGAEEGYVVSVEDAAPGALGKARRVPVRVSADESVGSLRKVIPVDDSVLAEGVPIVIGGAHYLRDGDRLRIVNTLALPGQAAP
ncbi:MAG: HlyD family efflux transporter periplasmic adaptor subunit [Planctomycetaceae bacterium]|nr:HlyD family efflux transporter periplasmic adaptor subunit [Planctomycetaceae bacterium]